MGDTWSAKVTLVAGHMEVLPPMFVDVVNVKSAAGCVLWIG